MKRILGLFLCLIVMIIGSFDSFASGERPWTVGDPSWDYAVDASDALIVLQTSLQLQDLSRYDVSTMEDEVYEKKPDFHSKLSVYNFHRIHLCGDVNGDDVLNAYDALLILQYAVGKIDAFPRQDFTSNRWRVQRYPQS